MNDLYHTVKPPSVLFLQGPPSRFMRAVGKQFQTQGCPVFRINLSIGDWLYWHGPATTSYRGSLADWDAYLTNFVVTRNITHIFYFADRFPYHKVAQKVSAKLGVRAISIEYGYLRPDWIILEPGGQSVWSHFTNEMDRIRTAAALMARPDMHLSYPYRSLPESAGDVIYHLSNYLLWFIYPQFVRDRVYNPIREYLSYIQRFWNQRKGRQTAEQRVAELSSGEQPFFVVPLQMQNDYQLRDNSGYSNQRTFLDVVLSSFGDYADNDAKLVIKIHPLDNGIEDWSGFLHRRVREMGLTQRVIFLDGGDLGKLAASSSGMVTINSTSGVLGLQRGCPVKVMGVAVYDIAGLTDQGPLDEFWTAAHQPIKSDVRALVTAIAHALHVRGNFYSADGIAAAAQAICDKTLANEIGGNLCDTDPPRLSQAKAMGIDVDA